MTTAKVPLSGREYQVIRLRALGYSCAEVGYELGIRTGTVNAYIKSAFNRAGADSLVVLLAELGWLTVPD